MRLLKRNFLGRIAGIAMALIGFAVVSVRAENYPARPIRILVPYAAGGIADIAARILGAKLTEAWGQRVIVENRTGANGFIAVGETVKIGARRLYAGDGHDWRHRH